MLERRSLIGLLVGLTICVSIWRVSILEPKMLANEMNNYNTNNQFLQSQQTAQITTFQNSKIHNNNHKLEEKQQLMNNLQLFLSTINNNEVQDGGHQQISNNSLDINATASLPAPPPGAAATAAAASQSIISKNRHYISNRILNYENDQSKLIDLNNFHYIINQKPCLHQFNNQNESTILLILIHSAYKNYNKRSLIRQTWASYHHKQIRILFVLANVENHKEQIEINYENRENLDIIQGNFIDNYRNMTYKHVMALKWFKDYCSNAKYLLKVDDDIFVNTPYLMQFLINNHNHNNSVLNHDNYEYLPPKNLIFCRPEMSSIVRRSYRSKWRVSIKEFPYKIYPPYCPGYAVLYSADVVKKLYELAQITKYFWIDDVHITGTLVRLANLTITPTTNYMLNYQQYKLLKLTINNKENLSTNKLFLTKLIERSKYDCIFWYATMIKYEAINLWNLLKTKYFI